MKQDYRLNLLQPYVMLQAEGYQKLDSDCAGVSHFYEFTLDASQQKGFQAVPDGSVDVLFEIGERQVHTYIGGTVLRAKNWPMEQGKTYFGVRFEPGKCMLPKDLGIHEVIDADLEIDGDSFGKNLSEQIALGTNIQERSRIFAEHYQGQQQVQEDMGIKRLESYMRKRIYQSKGNISIKALSEETGYSECYLRRVFQRVHGISPKVFEKFVRFQYLLNILQDNYRESKCHIGELALACGYYDQSHMIKEFKTFAGMTPEQYLKLFDRNEKREK